MKTFKKNDTSSIEQMMRPVIAEAERKLSEQSMLTFQTFYAITLHVLAEVHPKYLREAAEKVEIQARIKKRPVF